MPTSLMSTCLLVELCSRSYTVRHYTTPFSTAISSLSLNHHLYADDSQFLSLSSCHPRNFYSSIAHLQTTRQVQQFPAGCLQIFLLLTLLTEFLIIDLKSQLSKIDNSE